GGRVERGGGAREPGARRTPVRSFGGGRCPPSDETKWMALIGALAAQRHGLLRPPTRRRTPVRARRDRRPAVCDPTVPACPCAPLGRSQPTRRGRQRIGSP